MHSKKAKPTAGDLILGAISKLETRRANKLAWAERNLVEHRAAIELDHEKAMGPLRVALDALAATPVKN